MQQRGPAARRGFTLMETLAVVALIVVLLAVALPSLGKAGRELRGAELDADAQTLLAAAQSSMVLGAISGGASGNSFANE